MKTSRTVAIIGSEVLLHYGSEVEAMECLADASWEADLILIDKPDGELQHICNKIKPFVTMKSVVVFTDSDLLSQIKAWLPDSHVQVTSRKNIQNYKLNTNHYENNDI